MPGGLTHLATLEMELLAYLLRSSAELVLDYWSVGAYAELATSAPVTCYLAMKFLVTLLAGCGLRIHSLGLRIHNLPSLLQQGSYSSDSLSVFSNSDFVVLVLLAVLPVVVSVAQASSLTTPTYCQTMDCVLVDYLDASRSVGNLTCLHDDLRFLIQVLFPTLGGSLYDILVDYSSIVPHQVG